MNKLKVKIIKEVIKELQEEKDIIVKNLNLEKVGYEEKMNGKKINRFNFLKINYANFKNGDVSFSGFLLKSLFNLSPLIIVNGLYINKVISVGFLDEVSILLMLLLNIIIYLGLILIEFFDTETVVKKNHRNIFRRIKGVNKKIDKAIDYTQNIFSRFTKVEDLNEKIDLTSESRKMIDIFNRPIKASILNDLYNTFNEEQLKRIFQKTGSKNITYKSVIELIMELEKYDLSDSYYKEVFFKKSKEMELL
jgi:hypothetical protein